MRWLETNAAFLESLFALLLLVAPGCDGASWHLTVPDNGNVDAIVASAAARHELAPAAENHAFSYRDATANYFREIPLSTGPCSFYLCLRRLDDGRRDIVVGTFPYHEQDEARALRIELAEALGQPSSRWR